MTAQELISKLAEMSGALAVAMLLGLSPEFKQFHRLVLNIPKEKQNLLYLYLLYLSYLQ